MFVALALRHFVNSDLIKFKNKMRKKTLTIAESLKNDLFIIPVESELFLVYSPLRRKLFSVNESALKYVNSFISGNETSFNDDNASLLYEHLSVLNETFPESPIDNKEYFGKSITIILSQLCNMVCTYCYARKAHSNAVISTDYIKHFVDYCFDNSKYNIERVVSIGGGEPLITWKQLKDVILYIKNKNSEISSSIITNATLLDEEKCQFISKHNVGIVISFDIIPEIQRIQRPIRNLDSYEIVSQNIKLLEKFGIQCKGFRSTITMLNVKKMVLMVQFVIENYPLIKAINLEPVTDSGLPYTFYEDFIKYFIPAYELGRKHNINVYCSFSLSLEILKCRFCQRELCLTPTGEIVSCHRNSSSNDKHFNYFKIGYVDNNIISLEDYETMSSKKERPTSCNGCFAKWHCAGGCIDTRLKLSNKENKERCTFVRTLLSKLLYAKIQE